MKKVGTLIFLVLLAMIGANILHSTESELVSIKAYVRNQKGKITEIKYFKKSKSLKVDGVKQQLSHFSIDLNNLPKTTSGEDFKVKIFDNDTIYFENDLFIFSGDKQIINFIINPQSYDYLPTTDYQQYPVKIYVIIDTKQSENKKLKLKITGFEEYDGDIMIEKVSPSYDYRN